MSRHVHAQETRNLRQSSVGFRFSACYLRRWLLHSLQLRGRPIERRVYVQLRLRRSRGWLRHAQFRLVLALLNLPRTPTLPGTEGATPHNAAAPCRCTPPTGKTLVGEAPPPRL